MDQKRRKLYLEVEQMRKILAVVALAVGLVGCSGDSTGPKHYSTTGHWTGVAAGANFNMVLTENNGAITGSGSASASGGSIAFSVTGANAQNSVSMTIHASGLEDTNFTGAITTATSMGGHLNGSGFTGETLILTKS